MAGELATVRDTSEIERLRAQHDIIKDAFGRLILCPFDTTSENLRILDSATADGFWLLDVRSELRYPDSADMIGTDITLRPELGTDLPSNVRFARQDIKHEWPEEWQNSFDLVHQRLVLSATGSFDEAVTALRRLIRLLKPGGWLQVVEYAMPSGPIQSSDKPSDQLLKSIGNGLRSNLNLDPALTTRLPELVKAAGGLVDVEFRNATSVIGKGVPEHLLKQCETEINGLGLAFLARVGSKSASEVRALTEAVLEEARDKGFEQTWRAAWGRRPSN